jgi:hypothetical protein
MVLVVMVLVVAAWLLLPLDRREPRLTLDSACRALTAPPRAACLLPALYTRGVVGWDEEEASVFVCAKSGEPRLVDHR